MNEDITSCNDSTDEIDLSPVRHKPAAMLYSREAKQTSTVVEVGNAKIGGRDFAVIGGPCSIESRQQLFATAFAVQSAGAVVFRAGAFKPRTSPYTFQGAGKKGLELLKQINQELGIPVVTEVMDNENVELVSEHSDICRLAAVTARTFHC